MTEETRLMSVKGVAEFLGVSRKTVYRLIAQGELSGFKVGGVLRFRQVDIDAYLEQTRTKLRTPYYGRVFYDWVLTPYHQAPRKYLIVKRGPSYWFSLTEPYLKGLSPADRAREEFKPVKYRKIRSPKGENIIVVSPGYFNRLTPALQKEWLRFEIKPR